MNDYYQKLVEQECKHIRETVKITVMVGQEAIEHTNRELAERRRQSDTLKHCVAVNPDTGRANDIKTFAKMCHDIVDIPCSPRALQEALFDIGETVRGYDYPNEDRSSIIDALDYVRTKGHLDNCTMNQLYNVAHTMRRQNSDPRLRKTASAAL